MCKGPESEGVCGKATEKSDVAGHPVMGSQWWVVRTAGDRAEEGDWNLGLPVRVPTGRIRSSLVL